MQFLESYKIQRTLKVKEEHEKSEVKHIDDTAVLPVGNDIEETANLQRAIDDISLSGRNSWLSIEHKVLVYQQVLGPVWSYGAVTLYQREYPCTYSYSLLRKYQELQVMTVKKELEERAKESGGLQTLNFKPFERV
ncbi:hypothetical protein JTB14_026063 [Gonioctena quinquepunctata]|nr:hypothetical protein JTB14_026063 [Gonioctena quinquepunctata]